MSESLVQSVSLMGTVVTVQIVADGASGERKQECEDGAARALAWFHEVNARCSRFDVSSEVSQLSTHAGVPVAVSPVVFEALRFALAVAEESGGAFDPTVGLRMEQRGFDVEYRSGVKVRATFKSPRAVSFRDVTVDERARTVQLSTPLVLDLGGVAKGLAIDLAARELRSFRNFAIDAGGDLFLSGCNADGNPWSVGIRHPRRAGELLETLHVSDTAVCTSGDYERASPVDAGVHHIMDARTGEAAANCASVTVTGASAMVADALATAAFVLGPVAGLALLERHGVEGLIVTPGLERHVTRGMPIG